MTDPVQPSAPENTKPAFPYKTLIWAALALVAMFLFKSELGGLLSKAEKLSLFGIDIEVGKQQADKLSAAIKAYQVDIDGFNEQVAKQERQIAELERLKSRLQREVANCPDAGASVRQLNVKFDQIFKANTELKEKSDAIKNKKIITRNLSATKLQGQ